MLEPKYSLIQSFVIRNLNRFFELEKEREKSILEQSNRLLVFQTLLITALYAIVPLTEDKFGKFPFYIWICAAVITTVILLSLFLNLFSQWRFKYKTAIMPKNIVSFSKKHRLDFDSNKEFVETQNILFEMAESIYKNNKKRVALLKSAMIITFVAIGLILVLSLVFFF